MCAGVHLMARGVGMIEALLCDIDGTLVQSNWLHAEAWQIAFAAMGIELELEAVRMQIGKGGDELVPVFVPWWKRKQVEEPLEAYRKFVFQTDFLHRVKPLPKARDLLVRLQQAGIKTALASSASKQDLLIYKEIVGMDGLIDEETSADDAKRSKPHPDIFSATLKRLGVKPAKALALGDTPYDAEAAGKAGVWTIGVCSGGWSREDLLAAGCIEVYTDVAELLEQFDDSALMR
jgi:HAD superfamily hydrolase (TIGR01509 family)